MLSKYEKSVIKFINKGLVTGCHEDCLCPICIYVASAMVLADMFEDAKKKHKT